MRLARSRGQQEAEVVHYHCISRVVDRRFVLGEAEKEHFVRLMRGYEVFCGVRVVRFCVMSNHIHILLEVPNRPEVLPDDETLVKLLRRRGIRMGAGR